MQDMRPLLRVMAEEKDVQQTLLELSIQKRDVLIQNDVKALNGVVQHEERLVSKGRDLEDQRRQLLKNFAAELGIGEDKLTIAKVIELSEEPLKREFAELKKEMSDIVLRLKRGNEINRKLIQTHLDYTSFCVRLLTDTGESQTYNSKGSASGDTSAGFRVFDQRI